ncbi:uncharacterized protein LOC126666664 isoform X2 [Mercurialis annua]|uniref:uncharacterized protein LOC126666664 isoform X2 n=1 Tax=Mercurialis annua TaxID=3986 RepID=UPI002160592B|nr:uncharacterized protein LOC126666664 isoform X2 [Mercurialis annua]
MTGYRRSARITELEEKTRIQALQKQTSDASSSQSPPSAARKRGRKCKSLQAVVVNSVTTPHQEEGSKNEDIAFNSENSSSPQWLPKKETLEFILDILQRRDTEEIFAQPVDPEEVVDYYNIIKEPMDFGTMRAKLQEGLYTSLEQFERDVFLISSNAMKFNSSTTVYYTEARAISELGQRLFHSLRTEPENFQLEYSRTRKRTGKKAESEAGCLNIKSAKPGSAKNDQPLRRTTQPFLSPLYMKPYTGQTRNGILPVSRDVRSLTSSDTERRATYISPASFGRENGKIVSAVYNAPKSLTHVNHSGTSYVDSLLRFVKDLGPTAQNVALRKLTKYPIEAPTSHSWVPSPFGRATNYPFPTTSSLQIPAKLNMGSNNNQFPYNFMPNPSAAYKGKMVCTDEGSSAFGGELIPSHNSLGASPYAANSGLIDYNLLGEEGANTNTNTGACVSTTGKATGTAESADLLIATLMQISDVQNRANIAPSGTYYPLSGNENLFSAVSPHINSETQTWMPNKHSEPVYSHFSSGRAGTSIYCKGEGSSNVGPAPLNQINNGARSWIQSKSSEPNYLNYLSSTRAAAVLNQINNGSQSWMQTKPSEPNYLPCSSNSRATTFLYPNGNGPSNAVPASLNLINNESQSWMQNIPSESTCLPDLSSSKITAALYSSGEGSSSAGHAALNQVNSESEAWMHDKPLKSTFLPYSNSSNATVSAYLGEGSSSAGPAALNQINDERQSWMQNKSLDQTYLPCSNFTRTGVSLYPNGEGSSSAAPAALNDQVILQPEEWKQQALWGLPPICDLPVLQTHVNDQVPLMQPQLLQVPSAQEIPLINTMNFLGGVHLQGHQAESSNVQLLRNARQSLFMDNKQPDLDLQL